MINKKHLRLKQTTLFLVILISLSLLDNFTVTKAAEEGGGGWHEIAFNCEHPLLADSRVRRGLSHLVDRNWVVDYYKEINPWASDYIVLPGVTVWNPTIPWYNPHLQPDDNVATGLALLRAAGYLDEDGKRLELTLICPSSNPNRIVWCEGIVARWNSFGLLNITIHGSLAGYMDWFDEDDPYGGIIPRTFWHAALFDDDPTTKIPTYEEGGYDLVASSMSFAIPDPMVDPIIVGHIDELYTTGDPENFYQYSNANFDRLVNLYIKTGGNRGLAYAIQNTLQNDPPTIILVMTYTYY